MARSALHGVLNILPAHLRNKYFVTLVVFFAWIIVFDRHDLLTQFSLLRTERRLIAETADYKRKIEVAKLKSIDLQEHKERYARELFYLHKPQEDVFVIEEND